MSYDAYSEDIKKAEMRIKSVNRSIIELELLDEYTIANRLRQDLIRLEKELVDLKALQ